MLSPVAEPNIRVFTFSTLTVRSLTFAVTAVKSFVLNCSNSPERPFKFSIVAYVILAVSESSLLVSSSPILPDALCNSPVTVNTSVLMLLKLSVLDTTSSIFVSLLASISSMELPSTVPLSVVILFTVSAASLSFCCISVNVSFRLAISHVSLLGSSGYLDIFFIRCLIFVLEKLSINTTSSPIL